MYSMTVCWNACEDEDTCTQDFHAGHHRALDGSEDNVVSSDTASDVDVLGGL